MYQMTANNNNNPDAGLKVRFYKHTVNDRYQTEKQGTECFKERLYVEIINISNPYSVIQRPATLESIFDEEGKIIVQSDIDRFPFQYQIYKNNLEDTDIGLPIKAWTLRPDDGLIQALAIKKITTVEQLASYQHDDLIGIPNFYSLKHKAKQYLAMQQDNSTAEINKVIVQNENLKEQIEFLQQEMKKLNETTKKEMEAIKTVKKQDKSSVADLPMTLKVKTLKPKEKLPEVA